MSSRPCTISVGASSVASSPRMSCAIIAPTASRSPGAPRPPISSYSIAVSISVGWRIRFANARWRARRRPISARMPSGLPSGVRASALTRSIAGSGLKSPTETTAAESRASAARRVGSAARAPLRRTRPSNCRRRSRDRARGGRRRARRSARSPQSRSPRAAPASGRTPEGRGRPRAAVRRGAGSSRASSASACRGRGSARPACRPPGPCPRRARGGHRRSRREAGCATPRCASRAGRSRRSPRPRVLRRPASPVAPRRGEGACALPCCAVECISGSASRRAGDESSPRFVVGGPSGTEPQAGDLSLPAVRSPASGALRTHAPAAGRRLARPSPCAHAMRAARAGCGQAAAAGGSCAREAAAAVVETGRPLSPSARLVRSDARLHPAVHTLQSGLAAADQENRAPSASRARHSPARTCWSRRDRPARIDDAFP